MTQKDKALAEQRESAEPAAFTKRVGGTTYHVNVHFNETSKETLTDKIFRLIKREVSRS